MSSIANSSLVNSYSSLTSSPARATAKAVHGGWLGKLVAKILTEIEVRRAMRQISAFDDAMLRDIGLDRGGLEHPLRHGAAPLDARCELGR